MLRIWSKVLIVVVACLVAANVGFGGEKKEEKKKGEKPKFNVEDMFKRLDKNNDGKLSLKEYLESPVAKKIGEAKAKASFKDMDTDKDKSVSLKEFTAAMKKRMGERKGDKKPPKEK